MSSSPRGTPSPGAQRHLERLAEAHKLVRKAIYKAERGSYPTELSWFQQSSPRPELEGSLEALLATHSALLDYRDQVAIFGDELPSDLWEADLHDVTVPVSESKPKGSASTSNSPLLEYYREMESHHAQLQAERERPEPDTKTETVTLDDLDEWRGRTVSVYTRQTYPAAGVVVTEHSLRVVLPIGAINKAYTHLNRIIGELGVRVDVDPGLGEDNAPEPPTAPDHVIGSAPEFSENGTGRDQ